MVQNKKIGGKKKQLCVVKSENRKPNVDRVKLSDEYELITQSPSNSHCLMISAINAIDPQYQNVFTQSYDPNDYSCILNYIKGRPKHVIRNDDGSVNEQLQLTNNLSSGILCEDIIAYIKCELIDKGIAKSWECKSTQLSILDFISPPKSKFNHGDSFIIIGDTTTNNAYRDNASNQYLKAFEAARHMFINRTQKNRSFMNFLRSSIYNLQNRQSVIRNGNMARKSGGESNFTLHAVCVKFIDSKDGNGPLAFLFDPAMKVSKCLTVVHRLTEAKYLQNDSALFYESIEIFCKSIVETYHINSFHVDF